MIVRSFIDEFERYRVMGAKVLAELNEAELNFVPMVEGNSIAMIVRHISGNLLSRFTDFLESDGEKPWRDRDSEFAIRTYTVDEVSEHWQNGWAVLQAQLRTLCDEQLGQTVLIRRQPLTVHEALSRSLAHLAYHVGQIVLLARLQRGATWQSLSIPRGGSVAYNLDPTRDKKPV